MQPDMRFGPRDIDSYRFRFFGRGVWAVPGMPPGCPQDRGALEAVVRRCFAAAAAPRLGEAVWLGGWLKEGLKEGLYFYL